MPKSFTIHQREKVSDRNLMAFEINTHKFSREQKENEDKDT